MDRVGLDKLRIDGLFFEQGQNAFPVFVIADPADESSGETQGLKVKGKIKGRTAQTLIIREDVEQDFANREYQNKTSFLIKRG